MGAFHMVFYVFLTIFACFFIYRIFRGANKVVYRDKKGTYAPILENHQWKIRGKPDLILKNNWYVTVGEKKSGISAKDSPRFHDQMQLTAGFVLAEQYGTVRGGYLYYRNKSFYIKNTKRQRQKLADILEYMETSEKGGAVPVNPSKVKCRSCIYRKKQCTFSK